jgi:hypothetical protein
VQGVSGKNSPDSGEHPSGLRVESRKTEGLFSNIDPQRGYGRFLAVRFRAGGMD